MARVTIGDATVALEEFNGRRALKAAKILASLGEGWDRIRDKLATARDEFEAKHHEVLDRTAARAIYKPTPLLVPAEGEDGETVLEPVTAEDGSLVMGPDPLAHITDADWQANANMIRIPRKASWQDLALATFPTVITEAEEQITELLALCVVTNADYASARRTSEDEARELLREKADWLLDEGKAEQLAALVVAAGELLQSQFKDRMSELVDGLKNVLALVGLGPSGEPEMAVPSIPESPTSSSSRAPTSSTDSTEPTAEDGTKSEPSSEPAGESSVVSSPA